MVAEFLVVGICTLAFAFTAMVISTNLLERKTAGSRDFIEYWASGHQLRDHANPYEGGAIAQLERSAGYSPSALVLIMPNPPTALPLVFPLGFFGARTAAVLWDSLLLAGLVVSVRMVWRMHGSPAGAGRLLGYTFGPALACLMIGQVGLFLLLGLVLFMHYYRSRPILAGASLWLCALKPHLFLPFGVVLLAWVVVSRSHRILLGAVSAMAGSAVIAWMLAPRAWAQYSQMMRVARIDRLPIPCLCNLLRRTIDPSALWLQYVPAVLGCIWALDYFRRHRREWDWTRHSSPLVLVSVLVAPYTWFTDQAIVLPAMMHAVFVSRSRGLIAALALATAVIEIGPLFGMPVLQSPFYFWTAPAWIALYLLATRGNRAVTGEALPGWADESSNANQAGIKSARAQVVWR
jgi:hypothetical protein